MTPRHDFEKKSELLKEFLQLNIPEHALLPEFVAWLGALGSNFLEIAENLMMAAPDEKEHILGLLQIQHKLTGVLINKIKLK